MWRGEGEKKSESERARSEKSLGTGDRGMRLPFIMNQNPHPYE